MVGVVNPVLRVDGPSVVELVKRVHRRLRDVVWLAGRAARLSTSSLGSRGRGRGGSVQPLALSVGLEGRSRRGETEGGLLTHPVLDPAGHLYAVGGSGLVPGVPC